MQAEYNLPPRPPKRSYRQWVLFSFIVSLLMSGTAVGFILSTMEPKPNEQRVNPYPDPMLVEGQGTKYPLIYNGSLMSGHVIVESDEFYLPFEMVKNEIDPYLFYDQEAQAVILTTSDQVITLDNSHLTDELSNESVELQFPVKEVEGVIYVPYSPFKKIYPYEVTLNEPSNVVELVSFQKPTLYGEIVLPLPEEQGQEPVKAYVRTDHTDQAPYVQSLDNGAKITIHREKDAWYYIQTSDGYLGYVPKKEVVLGDIRTQPWEKPAKTFTPWNPIGDKINLTWEAVYNRTPNPSTITPPPGVNVVSPTWFHLQDEEGTLNNLADKRYVDWAHKHGYKVWALVTNDFNPDLTHEVLSSYAKRKNVIMQLLYFAEIYELDGINIDFENVYLKDKENLVQFMRELTPYLHEQGLVVSIDVTIKSLSEMWSLFLDRKALGEVVDYMMVMTYDEHWGTSPIAGSVASIPWVENGLKGILEEVPNEKVLLGVPFYTRLWKEETDEQGEIKVSSKAYSMVGIEEWLEEYNVSLVYDEKSGQRYGEYYDATDDDTYKVWLEDELSMSKRIDLVHKYDLAGVASWRRGFEKPAIWEVIQSGLENRLR
jgi:spore germination protein YaaH